MKTDYEHITQDDTSVEAVIEVFNNITEDKYKGKDVFFWINEDNDDAIEFLMCTDADEILVIFRTEGVAVNVLSICPQEDIQDDIESIKKLYKKTYR